MNIAIVIGVSEYLDTQNNLPGCQKDAELIYNILNKTSKYSEILYLNEKQPSAKVKERITEFISNNTKNKIDELVFYYTGHGEFNNDEFYFLLSDYAQEKRKQTSLQNEEVDNLVKTLKPELVVKIIDACQSGKAYIKEANAISKYFQKTQDRFNKCYFLNSSLKDQSSFQSNDISDFTLSFVKSIKDHKTNEIRYKDIIDFISDEFENNANQTPFFVIQADYTEKFCSINESLKEYLEKIDFNPASVQKSQANELSLLDKIKKQSDGYLSKDQVIQILNDIRLEVDKYVCSEKIKDMYSLAITFSENYDMIIEKSTIGKWLDDNPHEYFAKSKWARAKKDQYNRFSPYHLVSGGGLLNPLEDMYETVRDGFDLEVEVPYKSIIFDLNSKYPNIDSYTGRVVYVISKRQIRFFYFITNYVIKNWDERQINKKIEWSSSEHPISDKPSVLQGLRKIYDLLEGRVIKELEDKFNKQEPVKE